MITVQSMHGGQCSALVRELKPSVRPTISTETAVRDIGKDRSKAVIDAGSERATAQRDVKFATSKPSTTIMAGQSWLPPTNGGIQSSAFEVPQLANTQKPYLPSQWPNMASNVR